MRRIALITDSTCDLPGDIILRYCINIIPLQVVYKEKTYTDGVDITPEQVYDSLPREIPKTSLPSAGKVLEMLTKLKDEGIVNIISIHLSSGLSGTYSMVKNLEGNARKMGLNLHVIDSKSLSMGLGFLVIKAAQLIENNTPLPEILSSLNRLKKEIKVFFVLKSLEYLRKGGRIGLVEGTVGDVLSIKPIISINNEGIYYTAAKSRGRRGSITRLIDVVKQEIGSRRVKLAVMHGSASAEASEVIQRIKNEIDAGEILSGQIGPVIGVHTGPGLIGIGFCPE